MVTGTHRIVSPIVSMPNRAIVQAIVIFCRHRTGQDPFKKLLDKKLRLWTAHFLISKLDLFKNRSHFWRTWPKFGLGQAPELLFCVPRYVRSSGIDFRGPEAAERARISQNGPPPQNVQKWGPKSRPLKNDSRMVPRALEDIFLDSFSRWVQPWQREGLLICH